MPLKFDGDLDADPGVTATYGYARQYSGVNLSTYLKHITSSELTEQGLRNVGPAVMQLAKVEELEAHRRAVEIRLDYADGWVDLVRGQYRG